MSQKRHKKMVAKRSDLNIMFLTPSLLLLTLASKALTGLAKNFGPVLILSVSVQLYWGWLRVENVAIQFAI